MATTYNLNSFPENLKKNISSLISLNFAPDEQLLIIYYNKYKCDDQFSFEHLCGLIKRLTGISILRLTNKYKSTGKWNIKSINSRLINYLIEHFLLNVI